MTSAQTPEAQQAERDEAFYGAFWLCDYGAMQGLYDQSINIDYHPRTRCLYLEAAIRQKDPRMVEWLLKHGANPNGVMLDQNTVAPLIQAIQDADMGTAKEKEIYSKSARIIDLLLEYKADVNTTRGDHPPLVMALKGDYGELACRLVALGADVDETVGNFYSDPPVILAANLMAREVVPYGAEALDAILSKKPNLEWRNSSDGKTCLLEVIGMANPEPALRFIAAGADVHAIDKYGYGAVSRAAVSGKLSILKALHAKGAPLNILTKNALNSSGTMDLFALAARYGHLDVMEYLWEKGARFHPESISPPVVAAEENHVGALIWALGHGADTESRWGGRTALIKCAERGSVEAVSALLYAGADMTPRRKNSVMYIIKTKEETGLDCSELRAAIKAHDEDLDAEFLKARFEAGLLPTPKPTYLERLIHSLSPSTPLLMDNDGKATTLLLRFAGTSKLNVFFEEADWNGREEEVLALYDRFHNALPEHYQQRLHDTVDLSWARRELGGGSDNFSIRNKWRENATKGRPGLEIGS